MKRIKHYSGILLLAALIPSGGFGQCNTNTSICTYGTAGPFNFVNPGTPVSSCLDWIGPNTGYIILHITSSGPLNMLIDGNSSSGFLDVAVFNIPAGQSPCTAIQNPSNEIGCNYASAASGCNQFGTYFPCTSSVPAPNVTAGQELMIVVENWSGSSSNFTLQLGPTPGAQTGPPNPAITPAGPFCTTSSPVQLIAADMGGTWSGPGVSSTGMFNPAAAGPGTHTINYSIGTAPCNASSSTTITVNTNAVSVSSNTTICSGGSATLTASGSASYTWSPATGLSSTSGATVTASPAATTTYTVTGTTAGCSSTANVTVTVGSTPTVSPIGQQTYCDGMSVPATIFSGGPAGTVYNWTNSNTNIGLGSSGTNSLPAFTATDPTGNGISATINVTPTLGSCTGQMMSYTITVYGSNVTVSPNNATICPGGSTALSASGAMSYSWSPSTGLSSTTASNVTASPSATTTYTVTGTSGICTSTATVTVTVGGAPSVNTVANQAFCAGSTAPATNFTGGSAGTVYSWTNSTPAIGLAASGTGPLPSFTAINPGTTPVTATITVTPSAGTCTGTPMTFTITINPQPTVTAGNNGPLCEGEQMELTASAVTNGTYSWSGPNSFSGSTQNATIPNTQASDFGTYTVTVTSIGGCSNSATTTVTMNPGTQPAITPAGPFCADAGTVTLSASVPGGTWSGTGIVNAATGQFDPSAAAIGNNTITYVLNNGCVNPATTNIVIHPLPVVQFSANVLTGCVPLTVVLTNQSVPAGNGVTWDFGDNTTASGQTNTVTHTYTTAGCYDVTLTTSANGCQNSAIVQNYICALPVADAAFTVDDYTQTITDPTFQFLNASQNATSYSWEFGDGEGSNVTNPSHTYENEPGSYTVTLVADNAGGCRDTAWLTVQIEDELIFHIPNAFTPDGDEYNNTFQPVFYSGYDPFSFSMTIYNRWGEILFETHDATIGWDGSYNGATAKEGVYTWTIQFRNTGSDKKSVYSGHFSLID